jgi:formate dehydrogenase subunit delta
VTPQRLVHMANQIAVFFRSAPHEEAVAATADHPRKFWEPRMRRQIALHLQEDGDDLSEIARAAVAQLPEAKTTAAAS